jgi:hypothetical protein
MIYYLKISVLGAKKIADYCMKTEWVWDNCTNREALTNDR